MTSWPPHRGDLVCYLGNIYYFQPNGASCYLYASRDNIGFTDDADHTPATTSLVQPTPFDIRAVLFQNVREMNSSLSHRDPLDVLLEKLDDLI